MPEVQLTLAESVLANVEARREGRRNLTVKSGSYSQHLLGERGPLGVENRLQCPSQRRRELFVSMPRTCATSPAGSAAADLPHSRCGRTLRGS